jgi:hypothetical protein
MLCFVVGLCGLRLFVRAFSYGTVLTVAVILLVSVLYPARLSQRFVDAFVVCPRHFCLLMVVSVIIKKIIVRRSIV